MPNQKVKVESLDEIVFATRNKAYGAYELRKRYNKNVTRALAVALVVVLVATVWPLIASLYAESAKRAFEKNVLAEMMNVKAQKDEPPPPPPPPKVEIQQVQQVKYVAPVVVDSVDESKQISTNDQAISTAVNAEIDTTTIAVVTQVIDEVIEEKKPVFEIVEEMPEFTGGEEALRTYLALNTKYPTIARENAIEEKIFIRFVVTDKGSVSQVSVARGKDPSLCAEAIRVVQSLPRWKPGKQRGEAVNVWYTVPINFVLSK